eukprot:1157337-Pelagomonas_calceolata.AAC.6
MNQVTHVSSSSASSSSSSSSPSSSSPPCWLSSQVSICGQELGRPCHISQPVGRAGLSAAAVHMHRASSKHNR